MTGLSWMDPLLVGAWGSAIAAAALGVMGFAAVWTIRTGSPLARLLLIAGSLVWPLPDHPLQGPVLVKLTYSHGVHLTDLIAVIGVVIALLPRPGRNRSEHRRLR